MKWSEAIVVRYSGIYKLFVERKMKFVVAFSHMSHNNAKMRNTLASVQ